MLSEKQKEIIFRMLDRGDSSVDIARQLGISYGTSYRYRNAWIVRKKAKEVLKI